MLSPFLTCRFAYASEALTWDVYREVPKLLARSQKVIEYDGMVAWREPTVMTFSDSHWHGSASGLTLNPVRAIAMPRLRYKNNQLVVTISGLAIVATALRTALPVALQRISQKSVSLLPVRLKLGTFIGSEFEKRAERISSMEFLKTEGDRVLVQRGSARTLARPPDSLLHAKAEDVVSPGKWLAEPGLVSVGLSLDVCSCLVTRDFSVHLCDVESEFEQVFAALGETTDVFERYMSIVTA